MTQERKQAIKILERSDLEKSTQFFGVVYEGNNYYFYPLITHTRWFNQEMGYVAAKMGTTILPGWLMKLDGASKLPSRQGDYVLTLVGYHVMRNELARNYVAWCTAVDDGPPIDASANVEDALARMDRLMYSWWEDAALRARKETDRLHKAWKDTLAHSREINAGFPISIDIAKKIRQGMKKKSK